MKDKILKISIFSKLMNSMESNPKSHQEFSCRYGKLVLNLRVMTEEVAQT